MAYGLAEVCNDCNKAISSRESRVIQETISQNLEILLQNDTFIAEHCGTDAEIGTHTLYYYPHLGFMVRAHVNEKGRKSPLHDHGESWAIYGQSVGHTVMSEYQLINPVSETGKAKVRKVNQYWLMPGHAGIFGPRQIHSMKFLYGARFIPITGTDLSRIVTRIFDHIDDTESDVAPTIDS